MNDRPTPLGRSPVRAPDSVTDAAALLDETFRLHRALNRAAEEMAAACGLTATRWQLLDGVEESGGTVSSLARRLGLTRQSVQRTARCLEAEGYILFADNPDHSRAGIMRLTEEGERVLERLAAARAAWLESLGEGLPSANMRIAAGIMRGLLGRIPSDEA